VSVLSRIVPSRVVAIVALATLGGITACASAPVRVAGERHASSALFIAPYEVESTVASSAEDLLRRRRPHLLLPRAMHGSPARETTPLVYIDDVRQGGIEVLRLVPAGTIVDVRYLSWMEADARFTGRHPAGVILIRTRRPPTR
jgi:hypothetical protein